MSRQRRLRQKKRRRPTPRSARSAAALSGPCRPADGAPGCPLPNAIRSVASSLASNAYSTSSGLFRLAWRTGEAPVSATGFWTGFRTLFLGPTQRLFFSQQRAYKLANVSHTLVSKVETIAVCERERVAHVCCAALARCMPVHAHCGAHACSVLQEERKSQCTICQSSNLKLPS